MSYEPISPTALQAFTLHPTTYYSIETAARLSHMPRHRILVCCKRRLVAPRVDPDSGRMLFDSAGIQTLRRVEYLYAECGVNFTGIHIIMSLVGEVENFRAHERGHTGMEW